MRATSTCKKCHQIDDNPKFLPAGSLIAEEWALRIIEKYGPDSVLIIDQFEGMSRAEAKEYIRYGVVPKLYYLRKELLQFWCRCGWVSFQEPVEK